MSGFITPGFQLTGQENLNNDGGVIGPDNTPVVNEPEDLLLLIVLHLDQVFQ